LGLLTVLDHFSNFWTNMKLVLVKTLWGVPEAENPAQYDALFKRIKDEGFDAVEAFRLTYGPPNPNHVEFWAAVKKAGLQCITQVHTTGGYLDENGYAYCTSNNVEDHIASLKEHATEAHKLGALFINVHSGHDSWNIADTKKYFEAALELEQSLGTKIVHETHRQRQLHSPYQTRDVLGEPSLKRLRVNADLSHWCCVCEHVFEANSKRDDWWPPLLATLGPHVEFIHARVGHEQGPQVNDPSAPEHKSAVEAHLSWWESIWHAQKARGIEICYITPEFGPTPYLQTLPHTQAPVADLWGVNKHMAEIVRDRFRSVFGKDSVQ